MGNEHLARLAAARAVAFYVDPDNAIMFPEAAASDEALRAGARKPIDLPSRAASCDRFAARLRLGQPDAFGAGASRDRNEVLAVRLWSRESGSIPQVALPHAEARSPRFVVAHEWKVKESVGADVLGGPQPRSN